MATTAGLMSRAAISTLTRRQVRRTSRRAGASAMLRRAGWSAAAPKSTKIGARQRSAEAGVGSADGVDGDEHVLDEHQEHGAGEEPVADGAGARSDRQAADGGQHHHGHGGVDPVDDPVGDRDALVGHVRPEQPGPDQGLEADRR